MAYRKRNLLPIGIHLGTEAVHMAQLDQAEADVQMVSKASLYFPSNSADLQAPLSGDGQMDQMAQEAAEENLELGLSFIQKRISDNGFSGKEAVISLPSRHLLIRHVRLSAMPPEELAPALMSELRGKLPFDPQQAVVRHIVAGTVSENNEAKQDVIVLAARRSVVEKYVANIGRLGLQAIGVGAEPCAMCHPYGFAAAHAVASQEGPPSLMIVHLGTLASHVAIMRGQDTTFVKEVFQGTWQLTQSLAQAGGIPLEKATAMRASWCSAPTPQNVEAAVEAYNGIRPALEHLAEEIESCLRYHASLSRGARVDRVHFVGPDARDRGLVRVLSTCLAPPCEVGDPVGALVGRRDSDKAEPQLAVAVGLSLFSAE
jgi:type IV pilus assembly protein PilM